MDSWVSVGFSLNLIRIGSYFVSHVLIFSLNNLFKILNLLHVSSMMHAAFLFFSTFFCMFTYWWFLFDQIYVFFPEEQKVGVKTMKTYTNRMKSENVFRAILVVQQNLTPFARTCINEISTKFHLEVFQVKVLPKIKKTWLWLSWILAICMDFHYFLVRKY